MTLRYKGKDIINFETCTGQEFQSFIEFFKGFSGEDVGMFIFLNAAEIVEAKDNVFCEMFKRVVAERSAEDKVDVAEYGKPTISKANQQLLDVLNNQPDWKAKVDDILGEDSFTFLDNTDIEKTKLVMRILFEIATEK
jgi:hypothetical protein